MDFTEEKILQTLMGWRTRISAAAWIVVRDAHVAEDIFQNVVLKALTRRVHFESEGPLLSWAFITARREGLDWLRRREREDTNLEAEIHEVVEREWRSASASAESARLEALEECIAAAPERARRLLKLRYFEGSSCKAVAEQMGCGLDVVYKRLSRLHVSLRECVEGKLRGLDARGASVP